ncbi:MAG: glycoside hydrolase family 97 catalytic domain-containing protein [Bacteroidaceae bacterium]|nr:glycoside hydrolase family 97 catalytic domain-containing protein [Bacteroidaceae bacterium]
MKKNLFLTLMVSAMCMTAFAVDVKSPDGNLVVSVNPEKPSYSVTYKGNVMLEESPLGILVDMSSSPVLGDYQMDDRRLREGDFLTGPFKTVSVGAAAFDYSYEMNRSKFSKIDVKCNQLVVEIENAAGHPLVIEFMVSDNDVALRYRIMKKGARAGVRVLKEATGFRFPQETTTFLTPQSNSMIGWQRSKPSYEEGYSNDGQMNVRSQYGKGYTFPALFHVGEKGWVLLNETGVDSHYCGSHLSDYADGVYTIAYPMMDENNGNGTVEPALRIDDRKPGYTPWRTITVGDNLAPIVETTSPWDFVEPKYETRHDYKFGRSTWSWIVWQDASCNYDDQVKFIDLASEMGYEYILIDAGWDVNIGYERMEELIKYANSKNVDVFLWYSSSGYWNDIVQSPYDKMDNSIVRKKEMTWLEKANVKGIKVDFWGGDKQETMRLYEEVLSDADDHGLMVIFHGCTMPRGWERLYPNYVGSEAVLASENMYFGQGACDEEAFKATLHPFIRNAAGAMEFGGCFMNRILNRQNAGRGSRLKTSPVFQICTEILFQNPIQNIAICPNNLTDAPKVCMDFLREVPTTWDELKFIDGYPGKYVVLARRHGDKWYIAGVNATAETLKLKIDLSWLPDGQIACYTDDADMNPVLSEVKFKGKKPYTFEIKPSGGTMLVAEK